MDTELLDVEDKSYYCDTLEQLTGKPRSFWALVPLEFLKELCREMKRKNLMYLKRG